MKKFAAISKYARPSPAAKARGRLEPLRDAERTRQAILAAAVEEFADRGLAGARVDAIAGQSGANKRMLYYYFDSKEQLYLAVLERAYGAMRQAERGLNLTGAAPLDAIRALVEFKFDYYPEHPRLIRLLAGENMLDASFLKASRQLPEIRSQASTRCTSTSRITALSYFYFANRATLSVALNRDLTLPDEIRERRGRAIEVMLDYVGVQVG